MARNFVVMCSVLWWRFVHVFLLILNVSVPDELPVLKKENFNNWYSLKTYYAAVLITSIPLQISFTLVYSAPSYVLTGQPIELSRFAMFVLVLSSVTLLSDALGNLIGSCVKSVNGTFFGAITVCAMIVFAGFLVLPMHMNYVMRVVSYISFLKYVLEDLALSLYAYNRPPLMCPEDTLYCHLRYPKQILEQFSFNPDNFWRNIGVLLFELVLIRIISFYTLRRKISKSQ